MSDPWLDNIRTRATEAQFTDLSEILGLLTRVASLEAEVLRLRERLSVTLRALETSTKALAALDALLAAERAEVLRLRETQVDGRIAGLNQAITEWRDTGRLDETRATLARLFGHRATAPTSAPPDVPGAVARLWSAYGLAGAARPELRMVFSLLGAEPPEEDEPPASAPTSGQGAAATADDEAFEMPLPDCQDGVHVPGCRQYAAPAPAAQPATETCGTCGGYRTVRERPPTPEEEAAASKRVGARFGMKPCPDCTTPRKEGP